MARVAGPLRRPARLLMGRNRLRRSSDRIEGTVLTMLLAAFLASLLAAFSFGAHIYQSQLASMARLHPVVAVLSQNGPSDSLAGVGQARARWRAPGGRQQSGLLSTVTAPGIWEAAAGARIRVWVTSSGEPVAPPNQTAALFSALLVGWWIVGGSGLVLFICYRLCRFGLDRRRLRDWESEWALIGPRWTSLR
jgi:hypothetical protein